MEKTLKLCINSKTGKKIQYSHRGCTEDTTRNSATQTKIGWEICNAVDYLVGTRCYKVSNIEALLISKLSNENAIVLEIIYEGMSFLEARMYFDIDD